MSRLSCSLCILGSVPDLLLAIRRRPRFAARYALVEERIGHDFRHKSPIRKLIERAHGPEGPAPGVILTERDDFDQLEAEVLAQLDHPRKLRGGTAFTTQAPCATACSGCI